MLRAEREDNRNVFARFCLRHLDEVQRFLIRHPEHMQRAFPNFCRYVQYRQEHSPYFAHRWMGPATTVGEQAVTANEDIPGDIDAWGPSDDRG